METMGSKRKIGRSGAILIFLALVPILARGQSQEIPKLLNFQGIVQTSSGQPYNGEINITFTLYNHPTSSDPSFVLWQESQKVNATNGVYKVALGKTNAIDKNLITGNRILFLGIKPEGQAEQIPRAQILSAGFAYKADSSYRAIGLAHRPSAYAGHFDIDESNPGTLYFLLENDPVNIGIYLYGERFNLQFYTELGAHSHQIDPPATPTNNVNLSHYHTVIGCSDAACTFIPCGTNCSGERDSNYQLGSHNHTLNIDPFSSISTGVNGGTISSTQKTYLNGMKIEINGIDATYFLLMQAGLTSFGDGTASHIINTETGSGLLDLMSLTTIGLNRLTFRILAGNGGGRIRYTLYVNR